MPRLDRRFQTAIAIHELGLTGSATEVVFPAVQPADDRCAFDGLAAFETSHEHLNAMRNVRAGLALPTAARDVVLVRPDSPELPSPSEEPGRLVFPGQDRLRDDSAFPGLHGPANLRKVRDRGGNPPRSRTFRRFAGPWRPGKAESSRRRSCPGKTRRPGSSEGEGSSGESGRTSTTSRAAVGRASPARTLRMAFRCSWLVSNAARPSKAHRSSAGWTAGNTTSVAEPVRPSSWIAIAV